MKQRIIKVLSNVQETRHLTIAIAIKGTSVMLLSLAKKGLDGENGRKWRRVHG